METNSINTKPTPHHVYDVIRCGICRNELKKGATIYQEGLSFGVVFSDCYRANSEQDLELIANMFLAYGGYFGMLKRKKFSVYKALKKLISEIQGSKDSENIIELNTKMLHQALLYGVTPQEFIQGLKILLEE